MKPDIISADYTTKKERLSSDKMRSLYSLLFGERANQFDAFLKRPPNRPEFDQLSSALNKTGIRNKIFDLDGTLLSPYSNITQDVRYLIRDLQMDGSTVGIYTNSPHTDRLLDFRDEGVLIAENGIGKPTLEGYMRLCDKYGFDPKETAMVGNSPITDMPLTEDGEEPFFAMNILVESIPPEKRLIPSWRKYFRARLFHLLSVAATGIVLKRNKNILREPPRLQV